MQGYDHKTDREQGYEDARNGFPRASTRPNYRQGYDSGLSDLLKRTFEAADFTGAEEFAVRVIERHRESL